MPTLPLTKIAILRFLILLLFLMFVYFLFMIKNVKNWIIFEPGKSLHILVNMSLIDKLMLNSCLVPKKSQKHVYTNFEKVDIFVVKGVISWYRRLKSKTECRIRIQRAEKHRKWHFLGKKFFEKIDEKNLIAPSVVTSA